MATNFNSIGPPENGGYPLKKRFRSLLVPQTSLNLVGLSVTPTKLTLVFDRTPVLTGAALLVVNWTITGGTPITITAVNVVGNTIELTLTGTFDTNNYTAVIPAGLVADSGVPGFPFPYAGPESVVFAAGAFAPPPSPPSITNVIPTPGTPISVYTPLQFDVTDADTFAALLVYVAFADGTKELAYDGVSFSAGYQMSLVSPITDGSRFVVSRMGGWPSGPSLSVVAVDALGAFV